MQYFHLLLAYPLRMAEGEGSKTVIEHISRSPQGTLTDIQTQYGFYARYGNTGCGDFKRVVQN